MENKIKHIYEVGDNIKIVKYGQLMWQNKKGYAEMIASSKQFQRKWDMKLFGIDAENEPLVIDENVKPDNIISETELIWNYDRCPQFVGIEDVIDKVSIIQGTPKYSLVKTGSWFVEEQLELINKNSNKTTND
jgi:hypothetical protein